MESERGNVRLKLNGAQTSGSILFYFPSPSPKITKSGMLIDFMKWNYIYE